MNNAYAVFVDDDYYYDFIALYNSWKYYNNTIPIKVYSYFNLSLERKKEIGKYCELIEDINPGFNEADFKGRQLFKYYALSKHMADNEMIIDADMLFLNNNDYIFDYISNKNIVGAMEHDTMFNHKMASNIINDNEWANIVEQTKYKLKNHLGETVNSYHKNFEHKVYNGGFLGFNKQYHFDLIQKLISVMGDKNIPKEYAPFMNEQYVINFLIDIYKYKVHPLPTLEWMNTWENHRVPKKIIKSENNKIVVYNENGNRINMYHFTGGIGMPHHTATVGDKTITCRNRAWFDEKYLFNKQDLETLWLYKKECPVFLLYVYFASKGLGT